MAVDIGKWFNAERVPATEIWNENQRVWFDVTQGPKGPQAGNHPRG